MNDSTPQVIANGTPMNHSHRVEYCDDQPEDRGHHQVRPGCHGELGERRGHLRAHADRSQPPRDPGGLHAEEQQQREQEHNAGGDAGDPVQEGADELRDLAPVQLARQALQLLGPYTESYQQVGRRVHVLLGLVGVLRHLGGQPGDRDDNRGDHGQQHRVDEEDEYEGAEPADPAAPAHPGLHRGERDHQNERKEDGADQPGD
jgi:hypothetical protein